MNPSSSHPPIIHYVIQIEDREFSLIIRHDGMSLWDDHTERRNLRHPHHKFLELWAFAGNHAAFRRLQNECLEFTISASVTREIVVKATEMARQESKERAVTNGVEVTRCVAEMDRLLTEFFWEEINPLLSQPIPLPSES